LYYVNPKDRFAASYGSADISKIGFATNSKTRNQILTKLEEVLRRHEIKSYSSRLYEELKTFIWKNGKLQAQKGKNDDLVMSLAIGVWLYDTSPSLTQQGQKMADAMLAAFAVNSTSEEKDTSPFFNDRVRSQYYDVSRPILTDQDLAPKSESTSPDYWWLLK